MAIPVTLDEARARRTLADLTFTADRIPDRLAEHGDLMAPLLACRPTLPHL